MQLRAYIAGTLRGLRAFLLLSLNCMQNVNPQIDMSTWLTYLPRLVASRQSSSPGPGARQGPFQTRELARLLRSRRSL